MKKKALKKDFRMEIKKSLNRFLSIFLIVAMGVSFYSGIQASAPDMRATGDAYFDESHLMDLRVISTLGLTEKDLEALREVDGVKDAEGGYMTDELCQEAEEKKVLHVESVLEGMNLLTPQEGRLPQNASECFLDASYAEANGYKVGDRLQLSDSGDEEESALFSQSFTISGVGYSPAYISFERGSSTLGNGSVSGFLYVLPEAFDQEVYSVAYLTVEGGLEATAYTDEYEDLVSDVMDRVEGIQDIQCEKRYQEIVQEAQDAIDEARQELEDGKQELESAREELEEGESEAESQLESAREELEQGESELESGKQELIDAESEADDGEAQLAQGEQEILANETALNEAQNQIASGQQKLESGEREYQAGLKEYQASAKEGKASLDAAQKQIDDGRAQIAAGWETYESGVQALEQGQAQLAGARQELSQAQSEYEAGMAQFNQGQSEYDQSKAAIDQLQAAYDTGSAALAQGQSEYDANAAALNGLSQAMESERLACETLVSDYETAQTEAAQAQEAYGAREAEITPRLQELEGCRTAAESERTDLESQRAGKDSERSQYESEKSGYESQKVSVGEQIQSWDIKIQEYDAILQDETAAEDQKNQAAADKASAQAQKESLEGESSRLEGEIGRVQGLIDALSQEINAFDGSIAAKDQEIQGYVSESSALQTELNTLAENLALKNQNLENARALYEQQYEAKAAAVAQMEAQVQTASQALETARQELDSSGSQLQAMKQQLDTGNQELAAAKAVLDETAAQLEAAKAQIDSGQQELSAREAQAAQSSQELEAAKEELEARQQELDQAQQEVDAGRQELEAARQQLSAARQELDLGWSQLRDSQNQIAQGQAQLSGARSQIADTRQQIADARQQIADGWAEIEENQQTLADGWEEYEQGRQDAEQELEEARQKIKDAEQELADGEKEIEDAERELADIDYPEWYVYDRSALPENSGFGDNADRLKNIGEVFPVLFFLVAALISLTTMTRMVEEERTLIGTLKALGYNKVSIASKYIKYALYATLGGSVFGFLVGEKIFPWVIINAYGIMYEYLPHIVIPYQFSYGLIAGGAALVCTLGATLSACYRELQDVPANLMRPPSPKKGKRVLLERLPFIWKHLSFSWKSTIRNLMRYKKRFLMTIIGIGGCMGLLLVGFGLRDSIMGIAVLQFENLQLYDVLAVLDTGASQEEQDLAVEFLSGDERTEASMKFYMQLQEITSRAEQENQKEWSAYVYVPESLEGLDELFIFQDRETKEKYELTDEGAIITEKIAKELEVGPGESIFIQDDDKGEIEVPIAAVCENYLSHYLYIAPGLYEEVFGEAPEYNSVAVVTGDHSAEELGREALEQDGVMTITYSSSMKDQLDHMLGALDIVIFVLIVSAGLLAFVVLYNLNNININERKRELATIKVLGFYNGEVAAYVYRENILLTLIGAALGVVMGKLLHAFIITTVEVDACMFGRNINLSSFVIGTLFTFAFSAIVNFVMYFKLKKIDMVESLKSVE